jgi:hypothetical protein
VTEETQDNIWWKKIKCTEETAEKGKWLVRQVTCWDKTVKALRECHKTVSFAAVLTP